MTEAEQGSPRKLTFKTISNGLCGITADVARAHVQAAKVMLDHHGHRSGVVFDATGIQRSRYRLAFRLPGDRAKRTWGDLQSATEWGACAVAFLLVLDMTEFTVIERSARGTGIDYWLGHRDRPPFERAARLEVSGISKGGDDIFQSRVREKTVQTQRSAGALPAYVSVTEFRTPRSALVRHEEGT